jgi:hypothetical protein
MDEYDLSKYLKLIKFIYINKTDFTFQLFLVYFIIVKHNFYKIGFKEIYE